MAGDGDLLADVDASGRWASEYALLQAAATDRALDAAEIEQLAVAAHCVGRYEESTDAWSRACAAHLAAGATDDAALAAAWCAFALLTRGEVVRGGGWLARAQELCEQGGADCVARGFVKGQTAAGAMFGGDYEVALRGFEDSFGDAVRLGDPNGVVLGRLGRGQCLTSIGRVREGLALLDEAMVAMTTDEVSPIVAGLVYCAGIECSHRALDVRRAREWTTALTRWCDAQPDLVPYRGNCLVHRSEVLTFHGDWDQAFDEATRARDWLAETGGGPPLGGAHYRLGELHRLRGANDDAEHAYRAANQHGTEPQPGLALLRLTQGHVESATAAIRRALAEASDRPARARLLDAQVEVAIAASDLSTAAGAAAELATIGAESGVLLLRAQADRAAGAVALARGDAAGALAPLRASLGCWTELSAPYDTARVRVLIAEACRTLGDLDGAALEADAARWVFTELGAAPDLARLRDAGQEQPRASGLSVREAQVLRLVAAGKTNRAIAEELFLSEKTVHRHVSNIFAKVGVASRSAATAYAFQHGLV